MFETAEAREEAEHFREQARRDPLTGLRNRRYVDEELPALIAAGGELTVAIVDLDHFKWVNDRLSHDVGDQVLVLVAKLLETELAAIVPDSAHSGQRRLESAPIPSPGRSGVRLVSIRPERPRYSRPSANSSA